MIWNDYDDYQSRLNLIDKTNEIKEKIIKSVGKFKDDRLDDDEKMKIRAILDEYDENELDFITLSVYFIFAGNYAKNKEHLKEKIKYNRFVLKPLCKKGYLDGVERVRMDFEKLILSIPQEQIEKQEAFLILDPPYLQTTQNQYCSHFTSKEFFRMIELIFKPFILFSSEKSGILPFIENYQKYDKKGLFDDYLFDKEKAKIGSEDYIIYHCKRKGLFEEV